MRLPAASPKRGMVRLAVSHTMVVHSLETDMWMMLLPLVVADPGRFLPDDVEDSAHAETLRRAVAAADAVIADPRFQERLAARDNLLTRCSREPAVLDAPRFLQAMSVDPLSSRGDVAPFRFTELELLRTRGGTVSSTGNFAIRIKRRHKGLTSPATGVRGALLNTMVHEITHLARGATPGSFWVEDGCSWRRRRLRKDFRQQAASYQIGNMAQCFAWATEQDACGWETPYDLCMNAPIGTVGIIEHNPSGDADLPLVPAQCESNPG